MFRLHSKEFYGNFLLLWKERVSGKSKMNVGEPERERMRETERMGSLTT